MKSQRLAAWIGAGLLALWAPLATAQINTCDHLYPDPEDADRTLQQIIDAAEEGDIICLRGKHDGETPETNKPIFYFYPGGLDISKSITLRGGWDDDVDFLPNRIVLEGVNANAACVGNLLRDPGLDQYLPGNVNNAWQVTDDGGTGGSVSLVSLTDADVQALPMATPLNTSQFGDNNQVFLVRKFPSSLFYTASITQEVDSLPATLTDLRMDFGVSSPLSSLPPDTLTVRVLVDGVDTNAALLEPSALLGSVGEVLSPRWQFTPPPVGSVAGAPRRVTIEMEFINPAELALLLGNFCLQPTNVGALPTPPALRLTRPTADEAISVRLENLSVLSPSNTGVLVGDGVTLELNRCHVYGSEKGVATASNAPDARVVAISTVFFQNSEGAYLDGGSAMFFQCTFRDNASAIRAEGNASGARNVVACLFAGNGDPVEVTNAAAQVRLAGNMVFDSSGNVGTAVPNTGVVDTALAAVVPLPGTVTDPQDDLYLDTPWIGKLQETAELFASFGFQDLPQPVQAALNNRIFLFDFEQDPRGLSPLQVGADETRTSGATWFWQDVRFEYSDGTQPNRGLNGNLPAAVGRNRALAITVTLIGREPDDMFLYIVPELLLFDPVTGNPVPNPEAVVLDHGIPWGAGAKGIKAVDLFEATFTDSFASTYTDTPAGINGLVDGLATIVLVVDGEIYGAGFNTTNVNPGVLDRAGFIVDTTPPVISAPQFTGRDLIVTSNDNTAASPDYGPYPGQWQGVFEWPASFGTINDRYRDPQVFFNLQSQPLTFTVALPFRDDGPLTADGTGIWPVATAGFESYTVPPDDAYTVLYGGVDSEGALIGLADGQARWAGPDPGAVLDGALAEVSMADDGSGEFTAAWRVSNVTYQVPDNAWRMEGKFVARDRAGNEVASPRPLKLWWFTYAQARITSAPTGPTSAPAVAWSLVRPFPPPGALPAAPLARFKLWAQRFPGSPTSPWDEVDARWSPWTDRGVIDTNSIHVDNRRLRDTLQNPALANAVLGMSVVGADEAGNVQLPGTFAASEVSAADLVAAIATGFAWAQWENDEGPAPLDTRVQARFWHNRVAGSAANPANCNPTPLASVEIIDGDDIDFGASTRIPLPDKEVADFFRVEARFDVALSDDTVTFDWELYEDGIFVGGGRYFGGGGGGVVRIPQDVIVTPSPVGFQPAPGVSFLNANCGENCVRSLDRLGDEGCDNEQGGQFRRRDVTYTFVARAVDASTGRSDPTPATVTFTVYVDDTATDDQPIKEVSRGN